MTTAEQLYRRHLQAVTAPDAEAIRTLWEPGGLLEFPYAPVDGTGRLDGVDAVVAYFTGLPLFGPFTFRDLRVWPLSGPSGPDHGYLAEVHGSSRLLATGAPYEQDYVVRFGLAGDDRIAWMREYWDPTRL